MEAEVVIYTKPFCPYCIRAKQLLDSKGVEYEEIRIDINPEERETMLKKSNGAYTVPQIFINSQHVGGCTELMQLEYQNELDPLLET